jgi:hypothetical protein
MESKGSMAWPALMGSGGGSSRLWWWTLSTVHLPVGGRLWAIWLGLSMSFFCRGNTHAELSPEESGLTEIAS